MRNDALLDEKHERVAASAAAFVESKIVQFYELQHCLRTLSELTVGLTLIVSTLLGRIVASSSLGSRSCFCDTIR